MQLEHTDYISIYNNRHIHGNDASYYKLLLGGGPVEPIRLSCTQIYQSELCYDYQSVNRETECRRLSKMQMSSMPSLSHCTALQSSRHTRISSIEALGISCSSYTRFCKDFDLIEEITLGMLQLGRFTCSISGKCCLRFRILPRCHNVPHCGICSAAVGCPGARLAISSWATVVLNLGIIRLGMISLSTLQCSISSFQLFHTFAVPPNGFNGVLRHSD